jgi:hypothetical protein
MLHCILPEFLNFFYTSTYLLRGIHIRRVSLYMDVWMNIYGNIVIKMIVDYFGKKLHIKSVSLLDWN